MASMKRHRTQKCRITSLHRFLAFLVAIVFISQLTFMTRTRNLREGNSHEVTGTANRKKISNNLELESKAKATPSVGSILKRKYIVRKLPKNAPSMFTKSRLPDKAWQQITSFHKDNLEVFMKDDAESSSITYEEAAEGKQEILDVIIDAGIKDIDVETVAQLPKSSEIKRIYGEGPVILGLETCEAYRKKTPPELAHIGTAGLFNTGTNAFQNYIRMNCKMPKVVHDQEHGMKDRVPWGKHTLASRKWVNTAKNREHINKNHTMPVVLVRDPLSWMHSMCKNPYLAQWRRSPEHCPNLVPTTTDRRNLGVDKFQATINYSYARKSYDSLAHMWNGWNREYLEADYPRLMIRFEDMQLHPKQVIDSVCQCVGAVPLNEDASFVYLVGSAKGSKWKGDVKTNLVTGIIKTGSDKLRYLNMTKNDVKYTAEHLDKELMGLFQYSNTQHK